MLVPPQIAAQSLHGVLARVGIVTTQGNLGLQKINENSTGKRWNWMSVNTQKTNNICLPCFSTMELLYLDDFPLFFLKKKKKKKLGWTATWHVLYQNCITICFYHIRVQQRSWIIQQGSNQPYQTDRAHAVGHSQQLAWTLRIRGCVRLAVSFGSLPGTEWDGTWWDKSKTKNRFYLPVCGDRRLLFVQ